ncbi:MAG: DMT family transporter [Anaerolineales bacterium]|nr:DMT family transporter [Anaerolineales bacterium]
MQAKKALSRGLPAASASALFLGLTPIFGKLAITAGLPPLVVVAARTVGAAALIFLVMLIAQPTGFYIYPVGLAGCLLAGAVNGTGSLLYYSALGRIDASLGQLLYSLYPLFVALLLYLDGYRYTRMTVIRLGLSLPAVVLLTNPSSTHVDMIGVMLMLGAGLLYAVHIPINQRVLFEAPAPTVTFYTLLAMSAVVVPVALVFDVGPVRVSTAALLPLLALTLVTFLSRLSLFSGVKSIGGLDTALIGLGEIVVTLTLALLWLGERLTPTQWIGALLLIVSILLVALDKRRKRKPIVGGWLRWLVPPMMYEKQPKAPPPEAATEESEHDRPPDPT